MIKLVDYKTETKKDIRFGTCDLCFRTGDLKREFFVFKNDDNKEHTISTGGWSWGDYNVYYEVENVLKFADFINKLEFKTFEQLDECFDYAYELYVEMHEKQY